MFNRIMGFLFEKNFDVKVFSLILLLVVIVFFISDNLTEKKTKLILDEKFNVYSEKLTYDIESLIRSKKEMTLTIALSLAQSSNIKQALIKNDNTLLNLKDFSSVLRQKTSFKNVWFHIVDKKGTSFYRSWVNKSGDSLLNVRVDIAKMLKNPDIISTISVGKFDMTFKSMVPIYQNGEFIGIFEIITHFNSIVKNLLKNNVGAVALVDKKYKNQITKAFTKNFLDDYYIANLDADKSLLTYMHEKGVSNFFYNQKNYILDEEFAKLITFYNIPDINGNPLATIVAFKDLSSINTDDIKAIKTNIIFYTVLFIIALVVCGYYLVIRKYSKELNDKVSDRTRELDTEKSYMQTILDTSPSIILVMNGLNLIRANKSFLDFFGYESLEKFKNDNDVFCDFFISLNGKSFPKDKLIQDKIWPLYLSEDGKKDNVVKLRYNNEIYFFTINALIMNEDEILVTMQNITDLKNKEQLLYQQSKMASLGEMIGNIAHQWRQPLSIISTGATGMQVKKEYSLLSDEEFDTTCEMINTNAQYLSKTIDDFKNFIQGDTKPIEFDLKDDIEEFVNIVNSSIKKYQINMVLNLTEGIYLLGYPNELIQCFINIFNNSKDALLENNVADDRYVFISQDVVKDKIIIEFKDNAYGISDEIIDSVFEPYFTTKHKSQGTGLGLHMTYNLIVNAMRGTITVKNVEYEYENKKFKGACFSITIPLK